MNTRLQALMLIPILLGSVALTQIDFGESGDVGAVTTDKPVAIETAKPKTVSPASSFPRRKWDVLDPQVDAEAVLLFSLDDDMPLFRMNSYQPWPLASLTKLLTTVAVLEEMSSAKKIPISQTAVDTEGLAGALKSGEVYGTEDLLKILLLVSSNDAAAAFEEFGGGQKAFAELLGNKAKSIGMERTTIHDGSGLSDSNTGTATDLLKLTRYILTNHPDVFGWTRIPSQVIQPLNTTAIKVIDNIDPLVIEKNFLGGKTGTSPAARENLVALFAFHNRRVAVILLGSRSRIQTARSLLAWADRAYEW